MEVLFYLIIIVLYINLFRASRRERRRTDTLGQTVEALLAELQSLRERIGLLERRDSPAPQQAPLPEQAQSQEAPMPTPAESEPESELIVKLPAAPEFVLVAAATPAAAPAAEPAASPASQAESIAEATAKVALPPQRKPTPPREPTPPPAWLLAAKEWLFGGNLVAKMGLLILFIGVSFLLKYAAERVTAPIELRLAGVVIGDIALLVWGWRIRLSRRGISLPVQGAALGILMLVTFAAFRRFELIPGGLAFALLFALTGFTCLLAVLQNAVWLAVFGISGGFLAPIMTSTGQGSHVGLFSYYALLNAGILGIALKRAWRSLNLLGFAFTFVIGTAWGVLKYEPANYLSTQLFLILFVVFYVAIALAYAQRQAPQLKNYVDATLVFGVPLVAFGLQYGLVKQMPFGLAYSALGFGLFYTAIALVLWRRGAQNFRLLVESFLALGVVFGTLALPFALDGRWTSAAWALEGAGVVWVGLRQRQTLTVLFGLLVQAAAWISFLAAVGEVSGGGHRAAEANLWLGFLLLAGTAFLMARNFKANNDDLPAYLRTWTAAVFLTVAASWLLAGAWTEIFLRAKGATMSALLCASALLVAGILGTIATRMQWKLARTLALVVQVLAGLLLLAIAILSWNWNSSTQDLLDTPILGALMIFSGALFSSWAMQRNAPDAYRKTAGTLLFWAGFWWFGAILHILASWAGLRFEASVHGADSPAAWYGLFVAASAVAYAIAARRLAWPFLRWLASASWIGLFLATGMVLEYLYDGGAALALPGLAYVALWLSCEWLMRKWPDQGWPMHKLALRALHTLRTAGPWLMIWPLGGELIDNWLRGDGAAQQALLADAGWMASGSWGRYIPAWLMMLAIVWMVGRTRAKLWPTTPVSDWYSKVLIPLGTVWSLLLVAVWNLAQDGTMAPLPYLPVLNPLDLSSGFALLLAVICFRMLKADSPQEAGWHKQVPHALGGVAYLWFNLMLLRTAAHYLDLDYQFEPLFASQFVQAMLSLVWSISALVLMRRAAAKASRGQWIAGALLLGLVVAKLFLVDLSNVGGVARIISFVGVGLLMVVIGYLAPFPTNKAPAADASAA